MKPERQQFTIVVLGRTDSMSKQEEKTICVNRKARHDYTIEETYEAGMVLQGTEVKSLREGKANLKDSHVRISKGEAVLFNAHISPYPAANRFNHEPTRTRKLLLHKREILRLTGKVAEKGLTLIPLRLYFKNGRVKVELALARGKKLYDKRETLRRRFAQREVERALKAR